MVTDRRGIAGISLHRAASLLLLALFACTGCKDNAPAVAQATPTPARESVLGKVIRFGADGDSEQYRTSGWSKTEQQFTWSQGTSAKLNLPITAGAGALTLRARLAAFLNPPQLPSQPVELYANGTKVADWEISTTAELTADIPANVVANKTTLELEFRTPKATSPKAAGQGEDTRVLGVAVHDLQLSATQP